MSRNQNSPAQSVTRFPRCRRPMPRLLPLYGFFALLSSLANAVESPPPRYADPAPQRYHLTQRASEIDPRARAHPEIDFVFADKGGKAQDVENAVVDTRADGSSSG